MVLAAMVTAVADTSDGLPTATFRVAEQFGVSCKTGTCEQIVLLPLCCHTPFVVLFLVVYDVNWFQ